MLYRCPSQFCGVALADGRFPAPGRCPLCGEVFLEDVPARLPGLMLPAADPGAQRLPTPLALTFAEMAREPSPVVALWSCCDFGELALRLCVAAGVSEHGPQLPGSLVRALRDHVELPTLGRWLNMARAVTAHAPRDSALAGLPTAVEALDRLLGERTATPATGLLALRNRLAHGGPVSLAEASALRGVWVPRLRTFALREIGALADLRLVAVAVDGQRVLLQGEHPTPVEEPAVPSEAPPGTAWFVAGGRAHALDPLAGFDGERRAIEIYVRRGELRLQYVRLGEDGGLCEGGADSLVRFRERFLPPQPDGPSGRSVRGFDEEVRREAARRMGREAELQMLVDAARETQGGAVWVAGPAGIGKSNLMAALAENLLDAPPPGALVLAYRFRAGDERCGRAPFLAFVQERLEDGEWIEPPSAGTPSPGAARTADPVAELVGRLGRLREAKRVVLVLDGLDEVAERDSGFASEVALRIVGERVRVLGAGRPERGLPEDFARAGASMPFPGGLPPMREDDVRALLLDRTGPARRRLLARDRERAGVVTNAFVTSVVQRSEGLPLYVNYVAGDLNAGRISPEQPEALPTGLHAYHDDLLRRAAVGDLQALTTPVLVLLALSHEPLILDELSALLRRQGVLASTDTAVVERALQSVAAMVRRTPAVSGGEGFTVFHHSLRAHVLGSPAIRESVAASRAALANAALSPAGDAAEGYLYRCGVRHLLEADRGNEALGRMTDFAFVIERFRRLEGSTCAAEDWYADWDRVRASLALDGSGRAWWDFARSCRHHFRKIGWEPWRVLFQAAMDHADDSPVTLAAEAFVRQGGCDWHWLRWVNRPARWEQDGHVAVCVGHEQVGGLMALPSGRLLSWSGWTSDDEHSVRTWDPVTGTELARLDTGASDVRAVHRRGEDEVLVVTKAGATVWAPTTGTVLQSIAVPNVESARLLGDGRVALGTWGGLVLWDPSGERAVVSSEHPGGISHIYPVAGDLLLVEPSSTDRGVPALYDTTTGACVLRLGDAPNMVHGILECGGGVLVTWPHGDPSVPVLRVWDLDTRSLRTECRGHQGEIFEATETDDGTLCTAARDRTRRTWSLTDGRCLEESRTNAGPKRHLYRGVISVKLRSACERDAADRGSRTKSPRSRAEGVFARHTLADGRVIHLGADAVLLDPVTNEAVARLPLRRRPENWLGAVVAEFELRTGAAGVSRGLAIAVEGGDIEIIGLDAVDESSSATGRRAPFAGLVTIGAETVVSWERSEAAVWDATTGDLVARFQWHEHHVRGALGVPGDAVVSWSARVLHHWHARTGVLLATLKGHEDAVDGALALPGGKLLSWSKDRTLRTWDLATGMCLGIYRDHRYHGISARVLATGRVVSWDEDKDDRAIRYWDPMSGETLARLEGHAWPIRGVSVHDELLLGWSDSTVHVWNLRDPDRSVVLAGHTNRVCGAEVIDGDRLLSWSEDRTVRVWDLATGNAMLTMKMPRPDLRSAKRLADGGLLVRCAPAFPHGDELTLHVWNVDEGLLRGTLVPRAPRDVEALVALAGESSGVVAEAFWLLRLVVPHGYWQPVFLPGLRVAYSDGTRLRIVEVRRGNGAE